MTGGCSGVEACLVFPTRHADARAHSPVVAGGTAVRRVLLSYTSTNRFKPARLGNTWLARSGSRPLARSPSQSNGNESCEKKNDFQRACVGWFLLQLPGVEIRLPAQILHFKIKRGSSQLLVSPYGSGAGQGVGDHVQPSRCK